MCSPGNKEFMYNQTIEDEEEREVRNKAIDDLYEKRHSGLNVEEPNDRSLKKNETSDIYPPQHRPYNPNFRDSMINQKDDILDRSTQ